MRKANRPDGTTMKKLLLLVAILTTLAANAQTWQWVKNPQGIGAESGDGIVTDNLGNSYVRGYFSSDSIQFGNNITLVNPYASVNQQAFFLAKYDAAGNIVWANKIVGSVDAAYHPNGICIDNSQNIFIVSDFYAGVTINTTTLTTTTYIDSCFDIITLTWYPCVKYYKASLIAKYNSNGGLIWAKKICETKAGIPFYSNAIATDTSGNCYITGAFADTLYFNNGSSIIFNNPSTSTGTRHIFIAKTGSSGNTIWTKNACANSASGNYSTDIEFNSANLFITGAYIDTAIFDSHTLNGTGMFLARYDTTGNCLWAKKMGNIGQPRCIAIDKFDNCFITGWFRAQASFDTISLTSSGYEDMFITKYSPSGNALWAKQAGGDSLYDRNEGNGVAVDSLGNCYITGDIRDTVHFDTLTIICNDINIFVAKYNSSGNLVWVKRAGNVGTYNSLGFSIAVDNFGSVLVTGTYEVSALFDSISLTNGGGFDPFIAKLFDNTIGITEFIPEKNSSVVFPNPSTGNFILSFEGMIMKGEIEIINILGENVYTENIISAAQKEVHLKNIASGIYFVKVFDGEKYYCKKIIIEHD
jgi:hypothetical protein